MEKTRRYLEASNKVAKHLASQIGPDGKFLDPEVQLDLTPQYKLTSLLQSSGYNNEAQRLLDRIQRDYMQENGDFVSYPERPGRDRKSNTVAMTEHWMYINAWLVMGAHKAGRFDISYPAFDFCKTFFSPVVGGCCVTDPYDADDDALTVDVLSTTHFGLMCLFMGDLAKAKACGECMLKFISKQPNFEKEWLLRMNAHTGDLITTIPENLAPHYVIKKDGAYQLFFYIGYHSIFLTKLYLVTKDKRFLDSAKRILEFALTCDPSLYSFHLSHKVAYGAALYYGITKDETFRTLSGRIADFLLTKQGEDGMFLSELPKVDNYNQSSEIGFWLREIAAELNK